MVVVAEAAAVAEEVATDTRLGLRRLSKGRAVLITNHNSPATTEGVTLRSERILKTLDTGQNRFELCHQAFKAIRKLHNPGNRIQDTANDALQRLAGVEHQESAVDPVHANEAAGLELKQEDLAIESPAGAPQPEPMADDIVP